MKQVNERFTDTRGWMTNNAKKFTLQYIKTHSNVDNMPFVGEVETNQQRKCVAKTNNLNNNKKEFSLDKFQL
jgi:hypothetical protein